MWVEDEQELWHRYHRHKQSKMESQKVAYSKNKKKCNRHQHNTDDGRQAMGEETRHVQMSRWGKHIGEESKQQ